MLLQTLCKTAIFCFLLGIPVQITLPNCFYRTTKLFFFSSSSHIMGFLHITSPYPGLRIPLANSPNASRNEDWPVKIQTHSPVWRGFFPSTAPFYIFGQLLSDLASKNTEVLSSLASVLKNVFAPLPYRFYYVFFSFSFFISQDGVLTSLHREKLR
jgi:hypothetical protein